MEKKLEQFHNQKYINFETYKKDGSPVRTPVWFVIDNDLLYVITREHTGKVKRLKNNQNVRIVSCSFQGEPKNEWVKGMAQLITDESANKIINATTNPNKPVASAKANPKSKFGNCFAAADGFLIAPDK